MAIYMNHQRRRSDRSDWLAGCSARTGLLICALSAAAVAALAYWFAS